MCQNKTFTALMVTRVRRLEKNMHSSRWKLEKVIKCQLESVVEGEGERESEKCSALVKSYIFRFAALLISSGTGRYGTRGILFDFIIRALSALPLCFFLASIYYDGSQPLRRVSEDTLFLFEVHLMHVNQSYTKTIILITIIDIFFNEYSFFIFT